MALFGSFDPAAGDARRRCAAAAVHPAAPRSRRAGRQLSRRRPGRDARPRCGTRRSPTTAMWLPALRVAEAHAAHQPDTWMYRFDWPAADPDAGRAATASTSRSRSTPSIATDGMRSSRDPSERTLAGPAPSRQRGRRSPARATRPPTRCPTWPRFDARRRATMVLDAAPHVEDDPRGPVREALDGGVYAHVLARTGRLLSPRTAEGAAMHVDLTPDQKALQQELRDLLHGPHDARGARPASAAPRRPRTRSTRRSSARSAATAGWASAGRRSTAARTSPPSRTTSSSTRRRPAGARSRSSR